MLFEPNIAVRSIVTLHVSVWVEMILDKSAEALHTRHAPRERVSWNFVYIIQNTNLHSSRSTWACELKW